MPFKSAAQRKLFQAVAHGMKSRSGLTKKVAKQFIKDADDGGKQLDNSPVIFQKKPIAQARKRGKTR